MTSVPWSPALQTPVQAVAPEPEVQYAGLVTRTISFVIDAALLTLVDIVVGVGAALILAVLHIPHDLKAILAVIGAVAAILWLVGYFVAFWSATGQTPGARVMQIRVLSVDGKVIKPRRALLRCIGVFLAALPLFLGFVRILFDSRRRGFQDRLAGTVVVETQQLSFAQSRRATMRAARQDARARQLPPAMPD